MKSNLTLFPVINTPLVDIFFKRSGFNKSKSLTLNFNLPLSIETFSIFEDLFVGFNIFIYFGIVALVLLIDSICAICSASKRKKREDLEFEVRCHFGLKEDEEITKAHIAEYKKTKVINDERVTTEKKLSKQEKKIVKKLAKVEAKLNKKLKKLNK